jgi:hypothetical protein
MCFVSDDADILDDGEHDPSPSLMARVNDQAPRIE